MKPFLTRGRKVACLGAIGALTATTVLTAVPAQAADKGTIGFSPIALAIPALKGLSEGVKAVGGQLGYSTLILDPNFSAVKQAQQLTQVINAGKIDAGWVISVKPAANSKVARLAQSKKIPILFNGVPADYGFKGAQKGLSFSRVDYNKLGAGMGATAGQCITQKKLPADSEVIIFTPPAGQAGKAEQDAAVLKWLKQTAPNAQVVATITNVDRAAAQKDVAAALQAHPNVKVVTGGNDEGALGALSAFDAAGKSLPCLTENGGNDEVLGLVKSGKIYASSALNFQGDMMQTFAELGRLMRNPTAVGKLLSVPITIVKAP